MYSLKYVKSSNLFKLIKKIKFIINWYLIKKILLFKIN